MANKKFFVGGRIWEDDETLVKTFAGGRIIEQKAAAAPAGGRIMSSLAASGGLAGAGGIAGQGGGLAG